MNRLFTRLETLLLMACAGLFFLPLGGHALWDSDEGRYAEIAREMLATRDWLIPHLNGVIYFEKPPFTYWMTALGLHISGLNEFGARCFAALFGWMTIAVICRIGRYWRSERAGLLAGTVAATSMLFYALTQYLVVDMILTFWLTLAMDAGLRLMKETAPATLRLAGIAVAVAVAGAFLTKGLLGLVVPGIAFGVVWIRYRPAVGLRRLPWVWMIGIFAVLALPWVIAVSRQYPFFPTFFFVHEHVARFLTHVHHRSGPPYYFVPVVLIGFLPWVVFLPSVMKGWLANRGAALHRDPTAAVLVIWAVFIFVFFSLSGSKLPAYMLPLIPALALLTGEFFDRQFDAEAPSRPLLWGVDALIVFFLGLLILLKWTPGPRFMAEPPVSWVVDQSGMLGLVLALCAMILVGAWGLRRASAVFGGVLIAQTFFLGSITAMLPVLDPWFSTKALASIVATRAGPDDPVIVYGVAYETYVQSLAFYTRRRLVIEGPSGELALGQAHAPDAATWFTDTDNATAAVKRAPVGSWVVTDKEYWDKLGEADGQELFEQVEKSGRLILLQKTQ